MTHLVWTGFATTLITLVYFWTMMRCGAARQKYGIKAPAITGHIEFEKAFRIQANTLELLPLILPALWIFAISVSDTLAALCGFVFVIGRIVYTLGYGSADPAKRMPGMMISMLAALASWIGAIYGLVQSCLAGH
jgi:glutathione S-transferase